MLLRIVSSAVGLALSVGPALAQPPTRDDPVKAELEALRVKVQALQAQLQALQEKLDKAKADRVASEKYMRELADSCLEALLKGSGDDIRPILSKDIRDQYKGIVSYSDLWRPRTRGMEVSSYKITTVTAAPTGEEALYRGEIRGKSSREEAKEMTATFVLRVQKDKESGRYVVGFMSMRIK